MVTMGYLVTYQTDLIFFRISLSLGWYWFMVDSFYHALNSDRVQHLMITSWPLSTGGANHSYLSALSQARLARFIPVTASARSWFSLISHPIYVELKDWYKLLSSHTHTHTHIYIYIYIWIWLTCALNPLTHLFLKIFFWELKKYWQLF